MWDLPGPGIEPVSPALAGGFLTTAPPGKSQPGGIKRCFMSDSRALVCTFSPSDMRRLYLCYNLAYAYTLAGVLEWLDVHLHTFFFHAMSGIVQYFEALLFSLWPA